MMSELFDMISLRLYKSSSCEQDRAKDTQTEKVTQVTSSPQPRLVTIRDSKVPSADTT